MSHISQFFAGLIFRPSLVHKRAYVIPPIVSQVFSKYFILDRDSNSQPLGYEASALARLAMRTYIKVYLY